MHYERRSRVQYTSPMRCQSSIQRTKLGSKRAASERGTEADRTSCVHIKDNGKTRCMRKRGERRGRRRDKQRKAGNDVHEPMADEGNVGRGMPEGQIHVLGPNSEARTSQNGHHSGSLSRRTSAEAVVVVASRCVHTMSTSSVLVGRGTDGRVCE